LSPDKRGVNEPPPNSFDVDSDDAFGVPCCELVVLLMLLLLLTFNDSVAEEDDDDADNDEDTAPLLLEWLMLCGGVPM
jgi:hypothetical protein